MEDILQAYGAVSPMEVETGKRLKSTFWGDFTVADKFGKSAVQDTYNRSVNTFRKDKEYGTELSLVLNWKCWEHYEKGDEEMSALYKKLWGELDQYIMTNWKDEDLQYYLRETD